jgi:hypothetical protein
MAAAEPAIVTARALLTAAMSSVGSSSAISAAVSASLNASTAMRPVPRVRC